ncbi:hypothetical protein C5167_040774 [Papaver somniferum]|uniref:Ribosomal RNA methyltransferase FtsJ domain-containing protein n=1 Tax=Papaver somniferum TaxID=3469 RepID=A0A4Y7IIA8_PAPSO|nr:hypothetical protein C5167_040774 [Papaver somniferum]
MHKSQNMGGHKLEAAIELLNVNVAGKVTLDAGLTTGGFTDCLLQYRAPFVYGVDVVEKVHRDEHVSDSVIERSNLRYLTELPQKVKVDLVTFDLSFISILLVWFKMISYNCLLIYNLEVQTHEMSIYSSIPVPVLFIVILLFRANTCLELNVCI